MSETLIILQCTRTDSLDAFFNDTQFSAVPKIAVIGCGCSTATEPVAEISHYWNITHVSSAKPMTVLCFFFINLAVMNDLKQM